MNGEVITGVVHQQTELSGWGVAVILFVLLGISIYTNQRRNACIRSLEQRNQRLTHKLDRSTPK